MTTSAPVEAGRPARTRLTRERVLRAALEFVDAHDLGALSMHRLGAELGVKGMSLYTHVDSKDALLSGIVEAMWAELAIPATTGEGWRAALQRYARDVRALIHRHPRSAPLLASQPVLPLRALEIVDAYRRVLLGDGFSEESAIEALRSVFAYAHGYGLLEVSASACLASAGPEQDDLQVLRRVAEMVPRDTPDHLLRLAFLFCGCCDWEAQFEHGLDAMLRGLSGQGGSVLGSASQGALVLEDDERLNTERPARRSAGSGRPANAAGR